MSEFRLTPPNKHPLPPSTKRVLAMLLEHSHIEVDPETKRLRFVTEMPKGLGWNQLQGLHSRGLVFPVGDADRFWFADIDAVEALDEAGEGGATERRG